MPIQTLFSNGLIIVGACFMLTSIFISLKMLSGLPVLFRNQWKLLTGFMGFFLLGYLGFEFVSLAKIPLPTDLITGAIFLGGAFFVFLVIRLTRQTVDDLLNKDEQLKKINQELELRVEKRTHALHQTVTELDEVHQEVDHILNTISTGIRLINKDKTIRKVNKSFCTMTGLPEEQLIGSKCYTSFRDETCLDGPEYPFKKIDQNLKYTRADTSKTRHDGQQRHFIITTTPYNNAKGENSGIVEDFQDITERVQMELEREQLQTQLLQRSKLESVGQLAAGIAHEINTPVQYVGTNIDFFSESFDDISALLTVLNQQLAEGDENGLTRQQTESIRAALEEVDWEFLSEEIPTALEQTRDGVNRISTIVLAMKEFSHPGSKEMAPANLNDIINNTLTVSSNEWKYVADIKMDLQKNLPMVPCLSEEMGQVFLNIIVNAAHAISSQQEESGNDEKGLITITTGTEDDFAVIRISDSGIGMNEEVRRRIFDPFFTTKEVGKGTGQGLSIAQDVIITKHQGEILVESEPGRGTTFTLRLPLQLGQTGSLSAPE